jgi:hypothetical protein
MSRLGWTVDELADVRAVDALADMVLEAALSWATDPARLIETAKAYARACDERQRSEGGPVVNRP